MQLTLFYWRYAGQVAIYALGMFLAGCGGGLPSGVFKSASIARYDFGLDHSVAAPSAPIRSSAPVKLIAVSAPTALDTDLFYYRLLYANPQQLHRYAAARWSMPPAQLLYQRLRDRLEYASHPLAADGIARAPLLRVELIEFTQVFDRPGVSRGIVKLHASLSDNSSFAAQRDFAVDAPCPSSNAAGGAYALAAASDAVIDKLLDWIAALPLRQSQ